ncbi:MAG: hypothetical protein K9H49_03945 [Bacteroidales bacterium]|nr:hypothetical protein [Bacteroidales bacterium]MCF8390063.1 hypothetical protein [Bacteroidales bacterium]
MKKISREKALETSLVLSSAFLLLFILKPLMAFLYIAFGFGITGILIKPLAEVIAVLWFKFAEILNFFVSKLVLGSIFYFILFPISLLYRLTKKDPLNIRHAKASTWKKRDHQYQAEDMENIW